MKQFDFSPSDGGFSQTSGKPSTNEQERSEAHPTRDYSKYLHAEINNGKGVFVDGEIRDKTTLIESIKDVYRDLPAKSVDGDISPKARFLAEASTIFKLATSDIVGPSVDSVVDEVTDTVDDSIIPETKGQKVTADVKEHKITSFDSVFSPRKPEEEEKKEDGVEDSAEDYE
jgi:hypothetical protein